MASGIRNSKAPEVFVCSIGPGRITHLEYNRSQSRCKRGCFHAKEEIPINSNIRTDLIIGHQEQRKITKPVAPSFENDIYNSIDVYSNFIKLLYTIYGFDDELDDVLLDFFKEMVGRKSRLIILIKDNNDEEIFALHEEVAGLIKRASNLNKSISENELLQEFVKKVDLISSSKKTTEILLLIPDFIFSDKGEKKCVTDISIER
jgi:hypothetical protein